VSDKAATNAAPEHDRQQPEPAPASTDPVAVLQRSAGNAAVADLLSQRAEHGAERAAAAVLSRPAPRPVEPLSPPGPAPGGRPLAPADRAFFEPRFGNDFGDVRVAVDSEAASAQRARAYAEGSQIVFSARDWGGAERQPLLAHELAHVVQQASAGQSAIQRVPETKESTRSYPIPDYDFSGGHQREAEITKADTAGRVDLLYDGSTLRCTFYLDWRWPSGQWPAIAKRNVADKGVQERYKADFVDAIKKYWEATAPAFAEYEGGVRTGRSARLALNLVDVGAPVDPASSTPSRPAQASDVHTVDVAWSERASVRAGEMTLDANSLDAADIDTKRYRDPEKFPDYADRDVPISIDATQNKVKHVTAVHEFGHIIGLADEYVMIPQDVAKFRERTKYPEDVEDELRKRSHVTTRLMNVGMAIPNEYYRPFARWLSALTGKQWYVEGEAPKQRPASSGVKRKKELVP
jgi:hypothetical protein